jgi:hypothetical protein
LLLFDVFSLALGAYNEPIGLHITKEMFVPHTALELVGKQQRIKLLFPGVSHPAVTDISKEQYVSTKFTKNGGRSAGVVRLRTKVSEFVCFV